MTTSPPTEETESKKTEPTAAVGADALPDASALEDKMPEWFRSPWPFLLFTAVCGVCFFWYNNAMTIYHTDIWSHITYGELIYNAKAIPATEPLMPLSAGMRFVDTAWLSQVLTYKLFAWQGVAGLKFFHGFCVTLTVGLLIGLMYRRTKNVPMILIGLLFFFWVERIQFQIVRPQLTGLVCFTVLFLLLASRRWTGWHFAATTVLFACWANLHGSFVVGLALIAACCAGSWVDVLRRTDKISAAFSGTKFRRFLALAELAFIGTLLNPYGLAIYGDVLTFSNNLNLADILDWEALTIRSAQGQAMAFVALMLLLVYRMTPRRISCAELFQLVGLGVAALWTSRFIVWWGPVAAYYFVLHGSAIWYKSRGGVQSLEPLERKSLWTVSALGLAFIFFAITSFGLAVMHGEHGDFKQSVSASTPVDAVEHMLKDHAAGKLPAGQIFNTFEWGDYLLWKGHKQGFQVFAASHVHLVPREVWRDYLTASQLGNGWRDLLDRYSVNVVLIDTARHRGLVEALKNDTNWEQSYPPRNIQEHNAREKNEYVFYRIKPL